MGILSSRRCAQLAILGTLFLAWLPLSLAQNDQQAQAHLTNAKNAYNAKNYPAAIKSYRDFLAAFASHKDAPLARYGLAVSLLENPQPDYNGAIEQLQIIAANKELPQHAEALYDLGIAQRALGIQELAQSATNPKLQTSAQERFADAGKQFSAAAQAFAERSKGAAEKEAYALLESFAQARCDLAEMFLQAGKYKEAQSAVSSVLREERLTGSKVRRLAFYCDGLASFQLKEYHFAGRSLSLANPLNDEFGVHARYLLARIHHMQNERAEALADYEGALAEYDRQKKMAAELLKTPQTLRPPEKLRLEAFLREAPPEYIARALFYIAAMNFETGHFADAQAKFAAFAKQYPKSPLAGEAELHVGASMVQSKQFGEAIKTLTPLENKDPTLAVRALFWLGKAVAGSADPSNPQQAQGMNTRALETLKKAFDRAANDAEAKDIRGNILLEMADTQMQAKKFKEAAGSYQQLLTEKLAPAHEEEILQRLTAALNLSGDYDGSDQACTKFIQTYPKSTLMASVVFRQAENAGMRLVAAQANASLPNRVPELEKLGAEALKRYQVVLDKYPDFPHAGIARYQVALVHYRKGDLEKAIAMLENIPGPDRQGDLAVVPLVLADGLIRSTPLKAEDAIAAGRVSEQLQQALEQLEAFVGGQPKGPQVADALLKLGYCRQRLAAINAVPPEKAKLLADARVLYKRIYAEYPNSDEHATALFEEAKCFVQLGQHDRAVTNLQRFNGDPFQKSALAPVAAVQIANIRRAQNRSAEGVPVLAEARQKHEANLIKDPARIGQAAMLEYYHGVALKESGKLPEARAVFDGLVKQFPNTPEAADGALRLGQCLKEEALPKMQNNRQKLMAPLVQVDDITATLKAIDEESKPLREAASQLERTADEFSKQKKGTPEVQAQLLYEAAWSFRILSEIEIAAARFQTLQAQLPKAPPEATKRLLTPLTDLPLAKIPVGPAEQKSRQLYQTLIASAADQPVSVNAGLELGEMLAQRGENDAAIKLFNQALDREPAIDLADRIRIRLGAALTAKGDYKVAVPLLQSIVKRNPKALGLWAVPAQFLLGDAEMRASNFDAAIKDFLMFRDQPPYRDNPQWADRAMLRMGQTHLQLKQLDQSRAAFQNMVSRFGGSPFVADGYFGLAWVMQQQKDWEGAHRSYLQAANYNTPVSGRAQLLAGLCRMEQKRWAEAIGTLMPVMGRTSNPEITGAALVEAARAHAELKQKEPAEKLLQQVIREQPQSKWAEVAKADLQALNDKMPLKRPDELLTAQLQITDVPLASALPVLGQQVVERIPLDDPTTAISLANTLKMAVPDRKNAAGYLRLTLPDPFEFYHSVPARLLTSEEQVQPPVARLPLN